MIDRRKFQLACLASLIGIPGAVALDIRTGEEVCARESLRSSHASPILIDFEEQPTVVFHGMFELVGIDPQDGTVLWRQMLRREAADNVTFTPIWDAARSQVLISHGYCDFGTQAIKLQRRGGDWKTEINWTNSRLRIGHTNAVLIGTTLLGTPARRYLWQSTSEMGKLSFANEDLENRISSRLARNCWSWMRAEIWSAANFALTNWKRPGEFAF